MDRNQIIDAVLTEDAKIAAEATEWAKPVEDALKAQIKQLDKKKSFWRPITRVDMTGYINRIEYKAYEDTGPAFDVGVNTKTNEVKVCGWYSHGRMNIGFSKCVKTKVKTIDSKSIIAAIKKSLPAVWKAVEAYAEKYKKDYAKYLKDTGDYYG